MIPTREQIEGDWGDPRYSMATVVRTWLRAMRDEIDRLTAANEAGGAALLDAQREAAKLRAELAALKPSEDREAKIRAWAEGALAHQHDDGSFPMWKYEIDDAIALMRSAGDGKALLRELRAKLVGHGYLDLDLPMRTIDKMLARPAPVEQPAAAVPDHLPDTGKMVPVLYWLEDGKFARAMLVGKDLLVVDLTFGDGPSVVGRPEWFSAGYVAAYGGLVPESATQGKEPGQWDYGVASIAKPSAVPDDTRELVAQLADLFKVHLSCNGGVNRLRSDRAAEIAAKLRGGA